jgi:hypothetical protein
MSSKDAPRAWIKANWDGLFKAAANAAKSFKKESDDEILRLAESAAAAAANHPPSSRCGPTNPERFTTIARGEVCREVALTEAAALLLQNSSAAFKEAEKEALDAAARAGETLTGIQKDALASVRISVQRNWINALCC